MEYRRLGRTDIEVSRICLGSMNWGRQNSEAEAHAQIDYAFGQGVNFIDTAEVYPIPRQADLAGTTERFIGNWFKRTGKRDQWVLASKMTGRGVPFIREGRKIDAASLRLAVEGSLRRLQTDRIDLYQLHWPNRGTYHFTNSWTFDASRQDRQRAIAEIEEVLEAAAALVAEGKIRHLGLSNESAWGAMQFLKLAEARGWPRIVSVQNEYNLLKRIFDLDLAEVSHHEDVGLLAYSPLAAGALSGKYLDGVIPPGSRGSLENGVWRHNEFSAPAIRCYGNLARDYGLDVCQMAIAFVLSRPFTTAAIVGATSLEQLKTDIGAKDVVLDAGVLRGIESLFRRFPRTT